MGEGDAKTFICSCGHREKLSAYNKRKQEDKNKASKKDINKYLKSQNKNVENFNNPFAEALAKLKNNIKTYNIYTKDFIYFTC